MVIIDDTANPNAPYAFTGVSMAHFAIALVIMARNLSITFINLNNQMTKLNSTEVVMTMPQS